MKTPVMEIGTVVSTACPLSSKGVKNASDDVSDVRRR